MLCGMGKYGRVMTQYIGIVYDVIFLLLVLGAAAVIAAVVLVVRARRRS